MGNNTETILTNYKKYLINNSFTNKTITTYLYCIEQYFKFINSTLLTRENILSYREHMLIKSNKASTINQSLSAIKNYNEYLINENKMDSTVIIKRDFIKVQSDTNPCKVTKEMIAKFLNKVNTKECRYKTRNKAMIYFMIFSAARKSETYNVELKDAYDIEMNKKITILGKGTKERDVVIESEEVIQYINEYLKERKSESKYLFVSQNGDKFSESTLNKIFNFYSTPKCKIKPHDLRHWAATNMLANGYDIDQVQKQLGHSKLSTTGRYLITNIEDIRKKAKKMKAC
jgi:integrase/recombinase XerD